MCVKNYAVYAFKSFKSDPMYAIKAFFALIFSLCLPLYSVDIAEPVHFCIVVRATNAEDYQDANLKSIFNQYYQNWSLHYIDDNSLDDTGEMALFKIFDLADLHECLVYREPHKTYCQIFDEVMQEQDDKTVVVLMDGTSEFIGQNVLKQLAKQYSDANTWYLYANYYDAVLNYKGRKCEKIPPKLMKANDFKCYPWTIKHLRTFRAALYKHIDHKDFVVNNNANDGSWDFSILFPMLEMASQGHIKYVHKILYKHNEISPEEKVEEWLCSTEDELMTLQNKKPYKPLSTIYDAIKSPDSSHSTSAAQLLPALDTHQKEATEPLSLTES